ncbi:ankyrin repeat family A protein 2 isoform X2 [Procambarus clarkii]|nr:ankyrin repeat family A protein 2-like isoform X2 [Procambarus clarkii]
MGSSSDDDGGHLVVKEEDLEDDTGDDIDLWDSHTRRSAFSPYRPVTVLTNLQRGNIQTQTTQAEPDDFTLHNRAAMGELSADDLRDIDVDELDSNGFSPIMWAAYYGQLPTVKLLIQNRAKVDMEGEDGETAVLLAATNGHHEIIKLLISYGADPNHIDHMGNSALMYAAHNDNSHCANELLEHGADITATNVAGSSAFSIAVTRGSKQVQVIMERHILKLLEPS